LIGIDCSLDKIELYISILKEFHEIFTWSSEEIPDIDPQIVEHDIKTYDGANIVQQKLWLVNPKKVYTLKVEVEKFIRVGFIYPVPSMEWFLMPFQLKRNKVPFESLLILGILIKIYQRIIVLPNLLIISSMNVPTVKYFPSWMIFLAITRLR
jgi:hypothetical protein